MNRPEYVNNYLNNLWAARKKELDTVCVGKGNYLRQGMTLSFKSKTSHFRIKEGTILFSNNRLSFIVVSNSKCISYLKDLIPISEPMMWYDYYKDDLDGEVEK